MRHFLILPLLVGAVACADDPLLTGPVSGAPRFDIADAARGYKAGFYWLPPLVRQPMLTGSFDTQLTPTVEICELVDDACGPILATFATRTWPGSGISWLDAFIQDYHVIWNTRSYDLSTDKIYRVSVRAGINSVLLGYADVQVVDSWRGLRNVDSNEFIGLVDNWLLPIRFRIETGIVGEVSVEPVDAEAAPGATQQFVATLRDLHGTIMSAPVSWASSDDRVATIDHTGLATAVADGIVTITATAERITGSATLTVVGGVLVVSSGNAHTCALSPNGKAYCWGLNTFGQLGNGSTNNQLTPVAVAGNHTFRMIGTGDQHTCGLTTDGKAYCWGRNHAGQLGDGTWNLVSRSEPGPVSENRTFTTMSVGPGTTCAVTPTGEGFCWGANNQGNICINCGPQNPFLIPIQTGRFWTSIVPSNAHTCGLTTSGEAWCWGFNLSGELGANVLDIRSVPRQVVGGHLFTTLTLGQAHTCGLTAAHQAFCWGSNNFGILGAAIGGDQRSPVPVAGGHSFVKLSAGRAHNCALNTEGAAYCWGTASLGRLGLGADMVHKNSPNAVLGGLTFESIEAGDHTCAVTPSHQAYCWGPGSNGQLGNGSTAVQTTPARVAPLPQ